MILIGLIARLFTVNPNKKKLREIDRKIANSNDYKEIVRLTEEYNKIKNENKTN
jgi:hypothetical protein